jgi:hypothetical protein
VAVYLWAVLHDRPVSWACKPKNWPPELWTRKLPSQSTMSRRLRTAEVQHLLHCMERALAANASADWVLKIDGKPLTVGGYSKDRDAARGRAANGFARGYKLHAIYGCSPVPVAWELAAMNVAESTMARFTIPRLRSGGYLLGDCAFDSNALYELASSRGYQLVAPRQKPQAKLGHTRHQAARLRSIELLQTDFGRALYHERGRIERQFGWLTNHSAALAPLPAWVRRIHRVRLWVQAKIVIHAVYAIRRNHDPPLSDA